MAKLGFLTWLTDRLPAMRLGAADDANLSKPATRKVSRAIALCHGLLSERGEASRASLARELHSAYRSLGDSDLDHFFDLLSAEFSPNAAQIAKASATYVLDPSQANLAHLQDSVEPPRQELFRRMNIIAGGTAALVAMRKRVLRGLTAHPQWQGLEADLSHLLRSWFNRGFLNMQRIDWRTSALVLEKLIEYEAVHQIQGWRDLRRRLEADRRCYAYFHPALPDEPIIFIEVALSNGLSAKVQPLLDLDSTVRDPKNADHAIFYSITNCQEGLRGISFGNFLIKQVAEDLGREFPRLRHFATLSPIPGFRSWLQAQANSRSDKPEGPALKALMNTLAQPDWCQQPESELAEKLRVPLSQLTAYYLLRAKSRNRSAGDEPAEPLDPVSRFHLGNGAQLEQLNWLGDTSTAGMHRSCGLMVNYVYKLSEIERNHEAYVKQRRVIASSKLEDLANESILGKIV